MRSGLELYRQNRLLTDDQRGIEAEIFRRIVFGLRQHRLGGGIPLARAVADARNLWTTVHDLVSDDANHLPLELRLDLASLAKTLLAEMDKPLPEVDLDILIKATTHLAEGLEAKP